MQSPPFPWRPLTTLLLALAAQTMLEPPARVPVALALYALVIVFVLWSSRRDEWILPTHPLIPDSYPLIPNIRILPLLASLPLLGAAFYFFGDNQFTLLNLSLWLSGIAFFLRAFWQKTNPYTDDTDKRDFTESFKKEKSVFIRV